MTYLQVWHVTIQMGKRPELERVLREEVEPALARDPDFVGLRFYRRLIGPDLGGMIEFEYRSLAGAAKLGVDPEIYKILVPSVVSLLSGNRCELLVAGGTEYPP